jgi:hypothetical protein
MPGLLMPPLVINTLESPPRNAEAHLFADYIELLCLVNSDHTISKADVIDRLRERRDLGDALNDIEEQDDRPAQNDLAAQKAEDWYRHLEYRSHQFGNFYPFELSSDSAGLTRLENLDLRQKIYVFLLLAANQRCLDKTVASEVTSTFEVASLLALRSYMPQGSRTYLFGKTLHNKGKGHYSGKIWNKIDKLARDIRETNRCREEDFEPQNTGDGGLDVVAWAEIGDHAAGFLMAFGQCACSKEEWSAKQHSSRPEAWSNRLSFTVRPSNFAFIPFCFRRSTGDWYNRINIQESILVDRVRMIYLLRERYSALRKLIIDVVDEVLAQTEPVI